MKRWKVDRVNVFLFIAVVSFLYDLTAYIGIRDTARFPHPFVYFRSLGDIEALRGFAIMLRQALFSLVAGGSIGLTVGLLILRIGWLTQAAIRFLQIAMWFPFLVVFAAPYTFQLGIAATLLAAIYYHLTAQSYLARSARHAFPYIAGEVTLQAFFFSLISQIWVQRWNWMLNPVKTDAALAIVECGLVMAVVIVIGWIFKRTFRAGCEIYATKNNQQAHFSKGDFLGGMVLATSAWLLFWQLTCVALGYDDFRPIPAIQKAGEFLIIRDAWYDMFSSLAEVGGGVVFASLLCLAVSTFMRRSKDRQHVITIFLPATYIAPIVLWPLAFNLVFPIDANMNWYRSFFLNFGHKMMGVGFLIFFPLLQNFWAFRDLTSCQRWLITINNALPMAFVAMCFGELYAASAGVGLRMVIASATYESSQGLAWFLITVILLAALSNDTSVHCDIIGFSICADTNRLI